MKILPISLFLISFQIYAAESAMNYSDALRQYEYQRNTKKINNENINEFFNIKNRKMHDECGIKGKKLKAVVSITSQGKLFAIFPGNYFEIEEEKFRCYHNKLESTTFPVHSYKRYYVHTEL